MVKSSIKIVYLIASNRLSGGVRVAIQQAKGLANRGHAVTLVCPDPEPDWLSLGSACWETGTVDTSNALIHADVRIATFWTTVRPALKTFTGPVFHLCQGYEADFSFYAHIQKEIESAYRQPTHKLAVSPHLVDRLRGLGHTPVTYVGQTFDPMEFPPPETRPFKRFPPMVLIVGPFEADVKGVADALYALASLRRSGASFRLCRVSTLPYTVAERNIIEADEYHVDLPHWQMSHIYRTSDLFIGPFHPEEGFGLPVLEALSSGLPSLLSDTPSNRHIAGEAAVYFPCADVNALRVHCEALLTDASHRKHLSAMGPARAAGFSISFVVCKLESVFQEALAKR